MGRLERYRDEVAVIRAVGESAGRWITVVREASGEIDVRIRAGMLRLCSAEQVDQEIRTGLIAALADHRRQYRQLRIEYFGSPLGVEVFPAPETPDGTRRPS